LSEIALARRAGRRVIGLRTWYLVTPTGEPVPDEIEHAATPAEAVARALGEPPSA
jgi:hypothetical protein